MTGTCLIHRSGPGRLARVVVLAVVLTQGLGCQRKPTESSRGKNEPAAMQLVGRVVSGDRPVERARVQIKGRRDSVWTDREGRFQLEVMLAAPRAELTVTAAKPGYLIAGAKADRDSIEIHLTPLPPEDDPDYDWVEPGPDEAASHNCANCHAEIYRQWQAGGHARAAQGRHFLNVYDGSNWEGTAQAGWSLLDEYPDGAGICASCHAPAAGLDQLGVADIRSIDGLPEHGVHCDFCHKVQAVHADSLGLTHGRFAMALLRPSEGQLFFGPLPDVDRGDDSWLPLQSRSLFCAACHEGIVFGVPVYTTYREWLASPAAREGKQCQACHMKPDGQLVNIAPDAGGITRDPLSLASHDLLPGGRAAMLRGCLEVTSQCHTQPDHVNLVVTLKTHHVGHRVPTGFIDRHLILVVEAQDETGQPLAARTGTPLPAAAGDLAGKDGVLLAKRLIGPGGESPVPFWQAGGELVDTRLEPDATQVFEFQFPANANTFRVRLLYRRFWQQVADQKDWPDSTIVVEDQSWVGKRDQVPGWEKGSGPKSRNGPSGASHF